MTVKDLFLSCDKLLLKSIFMEMEDISITEKVLEEIFSILEETQPILSDNDIILGTEFVNIVDGLPRRIDISAYKISEIMSGFRYCEIADKSNLTQKEQDELNNFFSDIERYLIDLEKWNVILGFLVDESNVEKFGKDRFMAEILWSMTYYGYDEHEISSKRREYDRICSEVDSQKTNNTISLDDMAAMLFGNDFSLTQEEEEQISNETILNSLSTYDTIRCFYESRKNL